MANVELATAYISLVPTMQGVQGKVAEALLPAGAEADAAGKSSGGMFAGGFAGALGAAAVGIAAGAAAVGGAAVGLYKVGAVFDDITDTIRVGTGASGDALTGLVDIAKQVGTSVPTDFATAGSTVADLNTRLGLSGDTLSTVAQQYIQAGNILGETVDINATTAAFSAFGIEGANVEGAMDTLFQVSQATGVGMNELAAQVQTAAAPLQNLGFGFEETAALAGTLDKAGLNTSQIMSSMSKGLVTLAKSGEEPQAAFKRVTGELQGFVTEGNTAGALDLASKVFGTRGASQFVGALQSGKINLEDLTGAAGMTQDTILGLGAETADAAESWQIMKSKALLALEPMGTAVYDLAGKGLGFLASNMDAVTGTVTMGFSAMKAAFSDGDITSDGFVGVMETIGVGVREVSGGIHAMFAAFKAGDGDVTSSGFAGVMEQIGGAARGVFDAVKPAIEAIGPSIATLVPMFFQLFQALSPTSLIFQALLPVLPQIAAAIGGLLGQIVPLVASLAAQLIPIVTQLVSAILPPLTVIFTDIVTAIAPLISQIAGLLIPIIQALMPVVVTVFSVIASVITAAMQIVQGVIQVVTGIISGNWSQVWQGIGNIFGGIWNLIVSVVTGALQIIGQVVISGLGLVANFVGSALSGIGRFFVDVFNSTITNATSFIGTLLNFFGGLGGKIMGALGNIGALLFNTGKNIIQGLIDGIGSMMGAIGRAVMNIVPEAIRGPFEQLLGIRSPSRIFRGYGLNIGQGLILGIGDMHSDIESAVNGMVTVPSSPAFGSSSTAGDYRTSGGFGATYNIYETDDPIATAHAVARRQTSLAV